MMIKLTGALGGKGFTQGRHTAEHIKWLEANNGQTFPGERHNMNFYVLKGGEAEGKLVHIYEAMEANDVSNSTKTTHPAYRNAQPAQVTHDPVSRHVSMRYTDTLATVSAHHLDKAVIGANLCSGIETLISFTNLDGDELRAELQKLVDQYKSDKVSAKEKFERRGAAIDATVYADKS